MKNEEKVTNGGSKNLIIAIILTALLFGGGGFYGGILYQKSKTPNFQRFLDTNGNRNGNNMRFNGQTGNGGGFAPVEGEIIGNDDKSITVKLNDGSSKIVFYSDSTTIDKAETKTKEDLKTGEKVMVIGSTNSDGSVTARSIQLNPLFKNEAKPSQQP